MLISYLGMQSNKRDNTQPRPDVSEMQAPAPDRPSRPPRRESDDQEEVPEVVNDRMLKRIIAFCGIPVFTGFLLFPFFYYLKVSQSVLSKLHYTTCHRLADNHHVVCRSRSMWTCQCQLYT